MFIPCREIAEGPGPREAVIEVETRDGSVELVVSRSLVKNGTLEVGSVIGRDNGHSLIELPRESLSGQWRIWVATSALQTAQAA